jgi:hypothetical protein
MKSRRFTVIVYQEEGGTPVKVIACTKILALTRT